MINQIESHVGTHCNVFDSELAKLSVSPKTTRSRRWAIREYSVCQLLHFSLENADADGQTSVMALEQTQDLRRFHGALGEQIVADHVAGLGWQLVARNVRRREGEIDLIAIDQTTLVIGEVKTLVARRDTTAFSPLESVTAIKRARIRRLAVAWLSTLTSPDYEGPNIAFSEIRFDVFGVTLNAANEVISFDHVKAAF